MLNGRVVPEHLDTYPTPPQAPLEHKLTKEGDGGSHPEMRENEANSG